VIKHIAMIVDPSLSYCSFL